MALLKLRFLLILNQILLFSFVFGQENNLVSSKLSENNPFYKAFKNSLYLEEENSFKRFPDSIYLLYPINDSIHVISQAFFGSGNIIQVTLHKKQNEIFIPINSLNAYWQSDFFKPLLLRQLDSTAFFEISSEGSGTNFSANNSIIFQIKDEKLFTVFEYPKSISEINVEENPKRYFTLVLDRTKITRDEITLFVNYENGIVKKNRTKRMNTENDTVHFQFSNSCFCFEYQQATNSKSKPFWESKWDFQLLHNLNKQK